MKGSQEGYTVNVYFRFYFTTFSIKTQAIFIGVGIVLKKKTIFLAFGDTLEYDVSK